MNDGELIPHLFRTEYRKIVAVLCKHFGFDQMEMAEDIASDTFLTASQAWGIEGAPKNPTAWLYHVAKNKAVNYMRREGHFKNKIAPELREGGSVSREDEPAYREEEIDLSAQNINDSQLQMMFAICHPSIPEEAQIGLSLRILCGFGIEEIANAFLTNKETINKRLFRARERLRESTISIEIPGPADIDHRLETVLRTIYLLFNEGYYSVSQDKTMRKDLCLEAMRLCQLLVENRSTNQPQVNALLSLMCLHASRFEARQDENGEIILYQEQDEGLWNADLISRGGYYLHCATGGARLSKYHLEAGIAFWHTQKEDSREKWEQILQLYNHLLQIEYSPIAALNRTYALSKANGKQEAIVEARKLNLTGNQFYYSLLGELYSGVDDAEAKINFQKALSLARTIPSQRAIQKRMEGL